MAEFLELIQMSLFTKPIVYSNFQLSVKTRDFSKTFSYLKSQYAENHSFLIESSGLEQKIADFKRRLDNFRDCNDSLVLTNQCLELEREVFILMGQLAE